MSDLSSLLQRSIAQAKAKRDGFSLGASQVPAIVGIDPWKTADQLFLELLGVTEQDPENEHMKRGKFLEPGLCAWWCDLAGATRCEAFYASRGVVQGNGQLQVRHPAYPFARATPDVVAEATPVGMTRTMLVACDTKCPSSTRKKVGDAWVDSWSETAQLAPQHYLAQSTFQQGILRAAGVPVECGELAAGPSWGKLIRVHVPYDAELFDDLLQTTTRFHACLVAGVLSDEFKPGATQ